MQKFIRAALVVFIATTITWAQNSNDKPNILVLWGDDIGTWNISHNNRGMMGYQTPNIDRIAKEGVAFTDYYAQQSCTAGRAAFIGGSVPVRSGMTKVGLPGAKQGWQKTDVTMATVLKAQGLFLYATPHVHPPPHLLRLPSLASFAFHLLHYQRLVSSPFASI